METTEAPPAQVRAATASLTTTTTSSPGALPQPPREDSTPAPPTTDNGTLTKATTMPPTRKSLGKGEGKDKDKDGPMYTATTTTTRRNANGSVSSVYSGNKIRHLKKEDGIPLWRKDIQYEFLKYVFEDDKPVFHKASDGTGGHTFAESYLDAMARSSKCSKILKDKLLTERPAAVYMAMVCLLVNVGRMNTTLNFFPEMRAQLRTYHSIPCLQAHQDPNSYKQLQDAPRLKSILKGATEDIEQPSTLEDIRAHAIPRTNPVNLIFVLAQYAPKISELHFDYPRDFFDLVMKSNLSSRSRATAFLWLMWWYLESNFSKEDALSNPYGAGRYGSKDAQEEPPSGLPIKCPPFVVLTDEQEELENVDTEAELDFGEQKRKERIEILSCDQNQAPGGLRRFPLTKTFAPPPGYVSSLPPGSVVYMNAEDGSGSSPARDYQSPAPSASAPRSGPRKGMRAIKQDVDDSLYDTDRTRSASPPAHRHSKSGMRINTLLNDDETIAPRPAPPKGPGRGNWRRNRPSEADAAAGVHGPHGYYLPLNGSEPSLRRSNRPLTAHQLAVERYRKQKVEHILALKLIQSRRRATKKRRREGPLIRAWRRMRSVEGGMASWDSEDETGEDGANGGYGAEKAFYAPRGQMGLVTGVGERDDWGEEANLYAKTFRKLLRRSDRWEKGLAPVPRKRRSKSERDAEGEGDGEAGAADDDDEEREAEDQDEEMKDEDDEEEDEEIRRVEEILRREDAEAENEDEEMGEDTDDEGERPERSTAGTRMELEAM